MEMSSRKPSISSAPRSLLTTPRSPLWWQLAGSFLPESAAEPSISSQPAQAPKTLSSLLYHSALQSYPVQPLSGSPSQFSPSSPALTPALPSLSPGDHLRGQIPHCLMDAPHFWKFVSCGVKGNAYRGLKAASGRHSCEGDIRWTVRHVTF